MELEAITRQEQIIAGKDLQPVTRMEFFLKAYGGGGSGGGVQPDLSQTDTTKPDYVKGVIRKESLPEGYPYKEKGETVAMEEQELTFARMSGVAADMVVSLVSFTSEPTAGNKVKVVWDGNEYICEVFEDGLVFFGNSELVNSTVGSDEPFVFINDGGWACSCKGKNGDTHTVSVSIVTEIIRPMAPEFLPELTSPNGTKYKLTVSDDGTLSAVAQS